MGNLSGFAKFRVKGPEFTVQGLGFRVKGLGSTIYLYVVYVEVGVKGSGFRV